MHDNMSDRTIICVFFNLRKLSIDLLGFCNDVDNIFINR